MPGPSRPITDMDLSSALAKLFHSLPPRKGNLAELADGYKIALNGCTVHGLTEAVYLYIRGEIEGQSVSYAPTPPELSRAVRAIDRKAASVHGPAIAYTPQPFITVEMRMDAERVRLAKEGRKYLCSPPSHVAAQEMAKRGEIPPGSVYSGLLGSFYSPTNYQPEGKADDRSDSIRQPSRAAIRREDGEREPTAPGDASAAATSGIEAGSSDWRGLFDAERAADEQTEDDSAPDTFDGDRGARGHSIAAE